jgi:predicted RecA/RadA family phage recombinase
MTNYVKSGKVVTRTAPSGGVVSGTPYLIGSLLVVATKDAAVGEAFEGLAVGVISGTKAGSQAWTEGAKVYWDNSAKVFTTTAGGNTLVGVADAAVGAGASETTGNVRLDGVAR